MSNEKSRILKMIEKGKLGKEDGLKILNALEKTPPVTTISQVETISTKKVARFFGYIYNPFARLTSTKTMVIGIFVILLSVICGWLGGGRFDGALDIHPSLTMVRTGHRDAFLPLLLETLISWLSMAFSFYIFGIIFTKSKKRMIDYLGVTAIARFPFLIAVFIGGSWIGIGRSIGKLGTAKNLSGDPLFLLGAILMLFFIVWFLIMHFFAVKEASGCTLKKTWLIFIIGIILAELISKFLLLFMIYPLFF